MDWGSVAGLAIALAGILVGLKLEGGHLDSLFQPAAMLIVVVGTIGAVLLQSGTRQFTDGMRMLRWVFLTPVDDYEAVRRDMAIWNGVARREGLLSLDRYITKARSPFMAKGLRLVVDGIDSQTVRDILDRDISAYEIRQRLAVKVWEAAGGYAPTIGILGAVLGLIHVMENLADPARLGSGIAVAFVATIYGVGLANLVFLPIGARLKAMVAREVLKLEMIADVLVSIANGENNRLIEDRMAAYPR
jgi:chemotaxis protein MotA